MQTEYGSQSDGSTAILENAKMTEKEKDGIFFGLTMIIGIQCFTIYLVS